MGQISERAKYVSSGDALQCLPQSVVSLRKTYDNGYCSRWHSHSRFQLIYAVAGLMMAETKAATWAVPANHGLIIPPGTLHEIHMVGEVNIQSLYVKAHKMENSGTGQCRIINISSLLAALIDRFCALENQDPADSKAYHLSQLILLELADAPVAPLALPTPRHAGLRRVCEALLASPSLVKTIDHWADEIGMSRRSFTRSFKRQTGLSFGDWRQRLRCQAALQALARGEDLGKVAEKVGYDSPYSLRAMMQKLL